MRRLRSEYVWLGGFAAAFAALALIYRDSYQQDGGYHFLFARWGWERSDYFVGVWSRPLFTFLYSFPAQLGYPAAKLFTVGIACATAFVTHRLARRMEMERATAVVPLLCLQASFFLLASDTMTETLFAFLLVLALLLRHGGRVRTATIVASLLPAVRPEGFILLGVWVLFQLRDARLGNAARRVIWTALLGTGVAVWWLAALLITGDPLWILHHWPSNWSGRSPYGQGSPLSYVYGMREIVGPVWSVLLIPGVLLLVIRRRWFEIALLAALFGVHTALWSLGLFGSAGYARYFVCGAPLLALACLDGWNWLARRLARVRGAVTAVAMAGCLASAAFCVVYVDGHRYTRDFRAIEESVEWLKREHPHLKVTRLVWSQAYMCIMLDRDFHDRISPGQEAKPGDLPRGTLIFWDAETGPNWWNLRPRDFEAAGFRCLRRQRYDLSGYFVRNPIGGYGGVREQEMSLYYKD